MAKLTDDELLEVVSAINIFDTEGDGTLPLDKITDCLRALGLNPLKSEAKKIAEDMSDNGRHTRIEIDEFLPIYEYFQQRKKPTFEELCEGLKSLNLTDTEMGNTIPAKDLEIALTCLGDKLTHEECNTILSRVSDRKDQVNISKLVRLIMATDEATSKFMPSSASAFASAARSSQQESGYNFQILRNIKENPDD